MSGFDMMKNNLETLIKEQKKTNALLRKANKFKHKLAVIKEYNDGTAYFCSCGYYSKHYIDGVRNHIKEENK